MEKKQGEKIKDARERNHTGPASLLASATVPGCLRLVAGPVAVERSGETSGGGNEPRLNLGYEKGARWRTRCHRRRTNAERVFCPFNYTIFNSLVYALRSFLSCMRDKFARENKFQIITRYVYHRIALSC